MKKIGIGVVGVFILMVIVGAIFGGEEPARETKAAAIPTAGVPAIPAIPTTTPTMPTPTLVPTPTPAPTLMPTPTVEVSAGNFVACWALRDASKAFSDGLITSKGYTEKIKEASEVAENGMGIHELLRTLVWALTSPGSTDAEKVDLLFAVGQACANAGYLVFPTDNLQ